MEGLGAAANIIAVIELSAKIASLCLQYSRAVKKAKADIERLQGELDRLKITLEGAQQLLISPNSNRLHTSQRLHDGLRICDSQLKRLETRLEENLNIGKRKKVMSRFGIRSLKWPFESTEVNATITTLKNYRDELSAALSIDQTTEILDIGQKFILSKLPTAGDAAFGSYADQYDAQCHPETRVALRQNIMTWAEDPQSKCVFWLNGMAGTGKSTISRTVTQSFAEKGVLGGSFFFKRGEGNRSNAALLFTTIAAQLVTKEPILATCIRDAIDNNPDLPRKALKEQFEKLILEPLTILNNDAKKSKKIVLVIDALDECEQENDVKVIISLLSQTRVLKSVQLRTFVTSRPELPIRLGFNNIEGHYQDLLLHQIPAPIIEHDITAFLWYNLSRIRDEHNNQYSQNQLPSDWPGPDIVQKLVQMAVPLFIFAATVCRFIEDSAWSNPASQLAKIMRYKDTYIGADGIDATYHPILDQLLHKKAELAKKSIIQDFCSIVGSIILLAEPLSIASLARLLNRDESDIYGRLVSLHSVICVQPSADFPIRIFHLSFRDFLIDPDKRDTNPFWVDEKAVHEMIATRCLEILSSNGCLKKDICNLHTPGITHADIDPAIIDSYLPADVRYACLYWAYHLEQSGARITDSSQANIFLQNHFLHWLEALSLLGKISESITIMKSLQALTSLNDHTRVSSFLHDAIRFILYSKVGIEQAPLQIYCSALFFAPEESIIRRTFQNCIPNWIYKISRTRSNWSAALQTLEGHSSSVDSVAFSPDGKVIASGSGDETIRLWDIATGNSLRTLEGHSDWVRSVAFSPDGKVVASGSRDQTIRLWDVATGESLRTLEGHSRSVWSIAFSPDGKVVASGSDDETIRLWDVATGESLQILEGHSNRVYSIAFSPDGKMVASGSGDKTIRLWDVATGESLQTLEGHSGLEASSAFERYSISNNWIAEKVDGEMRNTIWLPPDYRPYGTSCYKGIIAMGIPSGSIFILKLEYEGFIFSRSKQVLV